jgi:Right handed beta helix region
MHRLISSYVLRVSLFGLRVLCVAVTPAEAETPAEFYISPKGDDTADGTAARPFASLKRASEAVRAVKKSSAGLPKGGLVVELQAGHYRESSDFKLTQEDSGTKISPITWRARAAETVTIDIGIHLLENAFDLVEGADADRLAPEARAQVYYADLKAAGIRNIGPFPLNFDTGGGLAELFLNAQRQPISRWPNEGPARIEKITDKGESAPGAPKRVGKFVAREQRVSHWNLNRGVWLEGYWRVPWDGRTVKAAAINPVTREITLAAPVSGGIGSKYAGSEGSGREPWWAVNLLEEIDLPGEWSIDFQTGLLFWWPPKNWRSGEIVLSDRTQPAILVEKAAHLKIENLSLEGGLLNGIEIRDSHYIEVSGCRIRNFGGSGIVVQKGEHVSVRSCDISDMGQSGIVLSGGDRATLRACNHTAENNHIQRIGVLKKTYAPGILVGTFGAGDAVGCRVAHNFIHDVPHGGIQYGGNKHLFEYNEISHAVLTSDDMGAFYTTNDWTSCGNVLRHNFVHHSPNAVAFYMDDGDSGDTIEGNVAYEMQSGPSVCGGHYNTVRNNLVVRCKRGLFMDARGIARKYDHQSPLFKKLLAQPIDTQPWTEHFPFLRGLSETDTRLPQGNIVVGNVTVQCEKAVRLAAKPEEIRGSRIEQNLDLAARDALFLDEAAGDLTLRKDSPIFAEAPGFDPIPFSKIGLFPDAYRTELPKRQWENPTQQWSAH